MPDEDRPTIERGMRLHPDMPRPNVPDNANLNEFEIGRFGLASTRMTYGHISKQRWKEIFGNGST